MDCSKLEDNVRAYLLSYPKSGNSWLRYIIEYTTGIPTIYEGHMRADKIASINAAAFGLLKTLDAPSIDYPVSSQPRIAWREERMNYDQGLILKKHTSRDIASHPELDPPPIKPETKLILLVRDPRDAIVRHNMHEAWEQFAKNVKYFSEWPSDKLLIYYEALLKYPEHSIREVSLFLNEKPEDKIVEQFMKDYDKHVELSASTYRTYGAKSNRRAYETQSINAPNFGIGHHHHNAKHAGERNKKLRGICDDPQVAEILRPYLEDKEW